MKIFIFLVLTAVLGLSVAEESSSGKIRVIGHDGKENRILSQELEYALACLRNLFINGDEFHNFPSLQEIRVGNFLVDLAQAGYFSMKADVTDFILHGLGNFTVNKVNLNIIGIVFEYDLEFHLTTSGKYTGGDLNIMEIIKVQGDGDLNLETVINPLGQAKIFPLSSGPPEEWVITVMEYYGFFLLRPDIHITGIEGDENLSRAISKQISLLIEHVVSEYAEDVSAMISPYIKDLLNDWISDPDSPLQELIRIAADNCPEAKHFMNFLHEEAVKQKLIKPAKV